MSTDKELGIQILIELIKKGVFKSHLETLQALKDLKILKISEDGKDIPFFKEQMTFEFNQAIDKAVPSALAADALAIRAFLEIFETGVIREDLNFDDAIKKLNEFSTTLAGR